MITTHRVFTKARNLEMKQRVIPPYQPIARRPQPRTAYPKPASRQNANTTPGWPHRWLHHHDAPTPKPEGPLRTASTVSDARFAQRYQGALATNVLMYRALPMPRLDADDAKSRNRENTLNNPSGPAVDPISIRSILIYTQTCATARG